MRGKRSMRELLQVDISSLTGKSEDPVKTFKRLIRELDDAILFQRGKIREQEKTIERMRESLDGKLAEAGSLMSKAEELVSRGDEVNARFALVEKKRVEKEAQDVESRWWEACCNKERLLERIRRLEDRAQEVRRRKEALVTKNRRGRNSSDFAPIFRDKNPDNFRKSTGTIAIDEELARLKKRFNK